MHAFIFSNLNLDKRDLATHDRHVHQNLRPFVCEHCGSAYKTKQALTGRHN